MKKQFLIISLLAMVLTMTYSCETPKPDADREAQRKTEQAMTEAAAEVGFPAITRFQELRIMKMIYEKRDDADFICHAYLVNELTGEIGQYLGQCIGYGLPYSTQFSNPEKYVYRSGGSGYTIPQPEPNGLFMPEGLAATWLLLIDPETGDSEPVYIEPPIIVSPFKLK